MQKINLRDLYPDAYKTDVFVDVAEEVLATIQGQQQDDAAYERRKFRHKAYYSLNRGDGIENDALNQPPTPEEILEQKAAEEGSVRGADAATRHPSPAYLRAVLPGHEGV